MNRTSQFIDLEGLIAREKKNYWGSSLGRPENWNSSKPIPIFADLGHAVKSYFPVREIQVEMRSKGTT
jgi:hypothetical protein